jgi:hypothetical protein
LSARWDVGGGVWEGLVSGRLAGNGCVTG